MKPSRIVLVWAILVGLLLLPALGRLRLPDSGIIQVVTAMMGMISVGIAVGTMLAANRNKKELDDWAAEKHEEVKSRLAYRSPISQPNPPTGIWTQVILAEAVLRAGGQIELPDKLVYHASNDDYILAMEHDPLLRTYIVKARRNKHASSDLYTGR